MFFFLSHLASSFSFLNVFRYITFRCMGALLTAFTFVFFCAPSFIAWMRKKGGQPIRLDGPESHFKKKGTPTMGGILMIVAFIFSVLTWADLSNPYIWIATGLLVGFGIIGGLDDSLKLLKKNSKGLSGRAKLISQTLVALAAILPLWGIEPSEISGQLFLPFFKHAILPLGLLYIFLGAWIVVGASNAVNLTDGLDGLAIGPVMIASMVFMIMAYLTGHHDFAHYLHLPFVPRAGELAIACSAVIGAGLGFLWYNAPPAMMMMGDVGALALGGFLGMISLMIKQECLLAIVGGIFVLEALSVMIQVAVFKRTKRRVFLMAPIHHHFEKKGWSEPMVVFRFWIISVLLGIFSLLTLKIR